MPLYIPNSCNNQIYSKVSNKNIYTHFDMNTYKCLTHNYSYRTLAPIKFTRKSTNTSSNIISMITITAFKIGFSRTATWNMISKSIINIKNTDELCFIWCCIASCAFERLWESQAQTIRAVNEFKYKKADVPMNQ
jgi:hypothetical protein